MTIEHDDQEIINELNDDAISHNVFADHAVVESFSISGDPGISLMKVKAELGDLLEAEYDRHEFDIQAGRAQYESALRLENEYHKNRVAELEKLIDVTNKRIKKRPT